uniref:Putative secreted protein n=1 Tax=Anopheles darlingi TaxID=43151 RepID=A0A2M4DD44_ANODA
MEILIYLFLLSPVIINAIIIIIIIAVDGTIITIRSAQPATHHQSPNSDCSSSINRNLFTITTPTLLWACWARTSILRNKSIRVCGPPPATTIVALVEATRRYRTPVHRMQPVPVATLATVATTAIPSTTTTTKAAAAPITTVKQPPQHRSAAVAACCSRLESSSRKRT